MLLLAADAIHAIGEEFRITLREFGIYAGAGIVIALLLWKWLDSRKGESHE